MKLMERFSNFIGRKELQAQAIKKLESEVTSLRHSVIDIVTAAADTAVTYTGNAYKTYTAQVTAISAKYSGTADWGNQICKNIIDVRSAFIVGNGVKPILKDEKIDSNRELEFIQAFIEYNNLDEEIPQEWAKEAEIEAKILLHISPNTKEGTAAASGGMIDVRHIPWNTQKYTVVSMPEDYAVYESVWYNQVNSEGRATGKKITYLPPEFVYKKFGGRTSTINTPNSKISQVLKTIEDIDKALYDWRVIDNLFASPTPTVECEDGDVALEVYDKLKEINWKPGALLVLGRAKFNMVAPQMSGIDALKNEIESKSMIVSGAVGVPIHFLGFAHLMSNRATADNLFELIWASTSKERKLWVGAYEELFAKVLRMANEYLHAGFQEEAITNIGASIMELSESKLQELKDIWLELYIANAISLDTFLSHVPEIDVEDEKAKIETAQAESLKRMQTQFNNDEAEGEEDENDIGDTGNE